MKRLIKVLFVLLLSQQAYAQHIYQIRADSVRIYNVCDTAELIIENRTRDVNGFLYNKGNGRTEFRRLRLENIGGSQIAISGQDTLDISTLSGIGGIDTIYRSGDNIHYVKKGISHTIYAPLPQFKAIPNGTSYAVGEYAANRITGFNAYSSPDMPPVSDQALTNLSSGNSYYAGHVAWNGSAGYQMAVNWDGELTGPKGVFVRNKDDTKTTWGAWRELVFKDYADGKYATVPSLQTSGQAQVHWDNITNRPSSFPTTSNLQTVTNNGAITTNTIEIDPVANAFRAFMIKRIVNGATSSVQLANNSYTSLAWIPDVSTPLTTYRVDIGTGSLKYYNGTSQVDIWRSDNHLAGSTFNPDLSGARVLQGIQSNASGHIVGINTRVLTPGDIGAAPATGSGNYIHNQLSSAQTANFWISGPAISNANFNSNQGVGAGTAIHYGLRSTGGLSRFSIGLADAEAGSNSGANFNIWRYNDAGTFLASALNINRTSGAVSIPGQTRIGANSGMYGTSTGTANIGYFAFYENNGTTRQGYVGKGSGSNNTIYITSDNGDVSIITEAVIRGTFSSNGLKITPISALGSAASTFLTHTEGVVQSRTAAQVLSDINAAPTTGSANYIQNQTSSAQSASFLVSGFGRFERAGSNIFDGTLSLYNIGRTRGVGLQLNGDTNPGLARWIHNGTTWVKRQEYFADGAASFNGGLQITNIQIPTTGAGLELQGSATLGYIHAYNRSTSATMPLKIQHTGGNTYINEGLGNVGIGTTSPSAKLTVNGNATFLGKTLIPSNSGIQGTATGITNTTYIAFYESNGTTRHGYVGKGSTSNNDVYLTSDIGSVQIAPLSNTTAIFETGKLRLTNTTSNLIEFGAVGVGAPTFTTRSAGAKIVLYPGMGPSNTDYAIGMESGHQWYGVNANSTSQGFKWYGATTEIARMDGTGNFRARSLASNNGTVNSYLTYASSGNVGVVGTSTAHPFAIYTSGVERMRANTGGNILIGTTTDNSTDKLQVNGSVSAAGNMTATSFYQTSLRSLKTNIQPFMGSAISILAGAQVRTFQFKADNTGKTNIGFIADEVPDEISIPERKGVDQASIVALLVKSVQELKQENERLRDDNAVLQQRMKEFEVSLEKLLHHQNK